MNRPVSLLILPPEILEAIISSIRFSLDALKALSQSCRCLHAIATPPLFRLVVIRSPESMKRFIEAATSSHYLTTLIKELQIHYHDLDEDTDDSPEDIEPVLSKLVNLESLVMRSSWFEAKKWDKMQLLCQPQETLPALRSCKPRQIFSLMHLSKTLLTNIGTLSFDYGYDWFFSFGSYGFLLHHPSLERLTIAGAQFQMCDITKRAVPFRSTCLQELTLLNCELHHFDIEAMLRYPHQLKHFTMKGQEARIPDYYIFPNKNRQLYIDALKSQSSCLETLDIDLQFNDWEEPIDLSEFSALQSLTISPRMLIGDNQCLWPKPAPALEWAKRLPYNLQHLIFRNGCGAFPILQIYEAVREDYIHLRSFTCQIASNVLEDGSLYYKEDELDANDHEGNPVFRSPSDIMSDISPDGVSYLQGFRVLDVELSVVEVPRLVRLPGYDSCPCFCWTYKHRLNDESVW
ncbi:hypothetical protein N7456_012013 [Penicillium angulare]|uniref:F-box domain-containing protein n=1 Tax=Penicillium angulare TaxID=116970 RepID=A0A9W9K191_9EURO|nr:hypothetical protein N7456_012013 [Penicillium angulare]